MIAEGDPGGQVAEGHAHHDVPVALGDGEVRRGALDLEARGTGGAERDLGVAGGGERGIRRGADGEKTARDRGDLEVLAAEHRASPCVGAREPLLARRLRYRWHRLHGKSLFRDVATAFECND
jgi:hypothetical protein